MNDNKAKDSTITNSYCLDSFTSYFPYSSLEQKDSKFRYEQLLEGVTGMVSDPEAGIYEIMKFADVNLNGF